MTTVTGFHDPCYRSGKQFASMEWKSVYFQAGFCTGSVHRHTNRTKASGTGLK